MVTDWLTVIYRYFGGNPDEGSDFISKGFVASAIFILYTRKLNPIFSDFQNQIFDFDIAAVDMTNPEWSYFFPRSRINLPFDLPFVFLGDKGETKLKLKKKIHFLSVFFFSIDPQKFIDGSTSSPGCSVINENPGLFKFWADPVKPWITIKGPKAAIWSRDKRNNLAVNFICLAQSRNRERRILPSFATPSWQCRKLGSRNVPQRTRPKANS